jgi:hypothetical protein
MSGREPEHLHLDIPNAWRQIERVTTRFVGERSDPGIALRGSHRRAGEKLIGCANRTALPGSRQQRQYQKKDGERASHWWKPIRRIFAPSVDALSRKCCKIAT